MKLNRIFGIFLVVSMLAALIPISHATELTVKIEGIGIPGEVLTAAVSGAPEDEEITYQWYYGPNGTADSLNRTRAITGATSREWTVNLDECIAVSYTEGKFSDYPVWVKVTCGEQSAEAGAFIAPGRNDGAVYNAVENTGADSVFAVDGKEFIVLDYDGEDLLILTKDGYGTHKFDHANSQRYSTERETNIGYWLNHDFLEAGNGESLPEGIKAYINEHTWITNNIVSSAERGIETTQDKAKLSLMSIEEFNQYSGRFGVADDMEYRWWLRSSSNGTQALCADIVKARAGEAGFTTRYDMTASLSVRPVFYLDKEFFANVKIDAYTAGTQIKDMILELYPDCGSLAAAGYSDDELAALGYDVEGPEYNFGDLESVVIHGARIEGTEWTAVWESPDIPEEMLEFQWYYGPSSISDPRTKAIPGAVSKSYTPDLDALTALNGVYNDWPIWLRVRLKTTGTIIDVQTSLPPARNYTGVEGAVRTTPPEYIFTVDGQDFILLDADDSGFAVLAKDAYGSMSFDSSKTSAKLDMDSDTNIGAWLNGSFFENGNGGKALSQRIKDSIVETEYKTTCLNNGIEEYTVRAKISLLSLEEYNRYAYKIGAAETGGAWWLRTATNATQVLAVTAGEDTGITDRRNVELASNVRPLFYLDRSFFTKERVEMGSEVMKLLGTVYTYDELSGIYTEHELVDQFNAVRGYKITDCRREDGCIAVDFENLTEALGSPVVIVQPLDGSGRVSISAFPVEPGQKGTIKIPVSSGQVEVSVWDNLYDMRILYGGTVI